MPDKTALICVARVYGPCALALVQAQLRRSDIWSVADMPHCTTTMSEMAIALGGTRVLVLAPDATEAHNVLASTPPLVGRGLRGWRAVLCVVFCCNAGCPAAPSQCFCNAAVTTVRRKSPDSRQMGWTPRTPTAIS